MEQNSATDFLTLFEQRYENELEKYNGQLLSQNHLKLTAESLAYFIERQIIWKVKEFKGKEIDPSKTIFIGKLNKLGGINTRVAYKTTKHEQVFFSNKFSEEDIKLVKSYNKTVRKMRIIIKQISKTTKKCEHYQFMMKEQEKRVKEMNRKKRKKEYLKQQKELKEMNERRRHHLKFGCIGRIKNEATESFKKFVFVIALTILLKLSYAPVAAENKKDDGFIYIDENDLRKFDSMESDNFNIKNLPSWFESIYVENYVVPMKLWSNLDLDIMVWNLQKEENCGLTKLVEKAAGLSIIRINLIDFNDDIDPDSYDYCRLFYWFFEREDIFSDYSYYTKNGIKGEQRSVEFNLSEIKRHICLTGSMFSSLTVSFKPPGERIVFCKSTGFFSVFPSVYTLQELGKTEQLQVENMSSSSVNHFIENSMSVINPMFLKEVENHNNELNVRNLMNEIKSERELFFKNRVPVKNKREIGGKHYEWLCSEWFLKLQLQSCPTLLKQAENCQYEIENDKIKKQLSVKLIGSGTVQYSSLSKLETKHCYLNCKFDIEDDTSIQLICPGNFEHKIELSSMINTKCYIPDIIALQSFFTLICKITLRPIWTLVLIIWLIIGKYLFIGILVIITWLIFKLRQISKKMVPNFDVELGMCDICRGVVRSREDFDMHLNCEDGICAYCKQKMIGSSLKQHLKLCQNYSNFVKIHDNNKYRTTWDYVRRSLKKRLMIKGITTTGYMGGIIILFIIIVSPLSAQANKTDCTEGNCIIKSSWISSQDFIINELQNTRLNAAQKNNSLTDQNLLISDQSNDEIFNSVLDMENQESDTPSIVDEFVLIDRSIETHIITEEEICGTICWHEDNKCNCANEYLIDRDKDDFDIDELEDTKFIKDEVDSNEKDSDSDKKKKKKKLEKILYLEKTEESLSSDNSEEELTGDERLNDIEKRIIQEKKKYLTRIHDDKHRLQRLRLLQSIQTNWGIVNIDEFFSPSEDMTNIELNWKTVNKEKEKILVTGTALGKINLQPGSGITWTISNEDSIESLTVSIFIYESRQLYNLIPKYFATNRKLHETFRGACTGDCPSECACNTNGNLCTYAMFQNDRKWTCNPTWCWNIGGGCSCCAITAEINPNWSVLVLESEYIKTTFILCLKLSNDKINCQYVDDNTKFQIENFEVTISKPIGEIKYLPEEIGLIYNKDIEKEFSLKNYENIVLDPNICSDNCLHGNIGDFKLYPNFKSQNDFMFGLINNKKVASASRKDKIKYQSSEKELEENLGKKRKNRLDSKKNKKVQKKQDSIISKKIHNMKRKQRAETVEYIDNLQKIQEQIKFKGIIYSNAVNIDLVKNNTRTFSVFTPEISKKVIEPQRNLSKVEPYIYYGNPSDENYFHKFFDGTTVQVFWSGIDIRSSCNAGNWPTCSYNGIVNDISELFSELNKTKTSLFRDFVEPYYSMSQIGQLFTRPKKLYGMIDISVQAKGVYLTRNKVSIKVENFKITNCIGCHNCNQGFTCGLKIKLKTPNSIYLHFESYYLHTIIDESSINVKLSESFYEIKGFTGLKETELKLCIKETGNCANYNMKLNDPDKKIVLKKNMILKKNDGELFKTKCSGINWFHCTWLNTKKFFSGLVDLFSLIFEHWYMIVITIIVIIISTLVVYFIIKLRRKRINIKLDKLDGVKVVDMKGFRDLATENKLNKRNSKKNLLKPQKNVVFNENFKDEEKMTDNDIRSGKSFHALDLKKRKGTESKSYYPL